MSLLAINCELPPETITHKKHPDVGKTGAVSVVIAGAGGAGAQMLACLARMDVALRSLGMPRLALTVFDPDYVSDSNVGRQPFYPSDIGLNKAIVLVNRINISFGLSWEAQPARYIGQPVNTPAEILITCVDTARARREIVVGCALAEQTQDVSPPRYILDLGNDAATGQVWLGELPRKGGDESTRLLTIMETFPELYDPNVPEDDTPTCSLAEALQTQDLYINDHTVRWAVHLLWQLLRHGSIEHRGYWVNLKDGSVRPQPIYAKAHG